MTAGRTETSSDAATISASNDRPSFYKEIRLAPSTENPRRLVFIAAGAAPKLPDDLLTLRQDFERTARVASVLFEDETITRKDVFLLLHQAADRGLRGPEFNIEDGRANLVEIRETILDFAHKIRDKRLKEYTVLLAVFGLIPLLLGAVVLLTAGFGQFNRPAPGQPYDPLFAWVVAAFWIPAGAAVVRLG